MHPNGAVHAVVDHEHDQTRAVLRGGCQFLRIHQEIAVARDADRDAIRKAQRRRDRRGQSVAHRAARRRQLRLRHLVGEKPVHPHREVARAVGDRRVRRERRCQVADDDGHVDTLARAWLGHRNEFFIFAPRVGGPLPPLW